MIVSSTIILNQAREWLGLKESDGSFKVIIDTYNSHKPYARGFKMNYKEAWCDCFISALFIKCNATEMIGTEIGVEKHVEIFKKLGIWIEDESITPKIGDIIVYDWQDNGKGDNKGYSDHIGIVEKIDGLKITVIEGNYSDSVKRRTIKVNDRYIRGYARPKYAEEPLYHTVVYGDTLWSISAKYLGSGSKYTLIKQLNGLTSDTIYPKQKLRIPRL